MKIKVNAVKDSSGKVIATFEKTSGDGPSVEPVLEHGHTLHEIEVSGNYKEDIKAFYAQL